MPTSSPVTQLLNAAAKGDSAAREELWSVIYGELKQIARHQMAGEAPGRTLQPTAVIHEAYIRLVGSPGVAWANRAHFFAAAAEAMRRIRVEDARKRRRRKRGGGRRKESLDAPAASVGDGVPTALAVFDQDPAEVLAVDEALARLKDQDPRKGQVVVLRYFGGLTVEETAAALGVSPRTVEMDWRIARAWLKRELS